MKNYHFLINNEEYKPFYFINQNNEEIFLKDYGVSVKGKVYNVTSKTFETPVRTGHAFSYVFEGREYSVKGLLKFIWKIKTKEERNLILKQLLSEYDLKQKVNIYPITTFEILKFYGKRLKLLMDFKNITSEQLAGDLNIPVKNIEYYIELKKIPNSIIVGRLANYFKIDRAYFEMENWTLTLDLNLTKNNYDIFYK